LTRRKEYDRAMQRTIPVRVTPEQRRWLERRALEEDRTMASVLRRLIESARSQGQDEQRQTA
jgi:hypothetical protein